jgi:23S rRNA pseudouridine1911/1915/1917 synthase
MIRYLSIDVVQGDAPCKNGYLTTAPAQSKQRVMTSNPITAQATVDAVFFGQRLDQVAAELFPDYSRSRLQQWIKDGQLTVNGECRKPRDKVVGGELLTLDARQESQGEWVSQSIPLDIVYEDEQLIVINKPVGLVVHPGAGNQDGTLLNALLNHFPDQVLLPRAGIVHRLDKDTSGLMVVARTLKAQNALVEQLQARTVKRQYEAVVQGEMISGGTVSAPIGRHPRVRTRMAVVAGGKEAVTHYRVLERYTGYTHIRVNLETGRTHQIRVHMAHVGFPLVGDALYGGRLKLPAGASDHLLEVLRGFRRQALHAAELNLEHPITGDLISWTSPLPDDFQALLMALAQG